ARHGHIALPLSAASTCSPTVRAFYLCVSLPPTPGSCGSASAPPRNHLERGMDKTITKFIMHPVSTSSCTNSIYARTRLRWMDGICDDLSADITHDACEGGRRTNLCVQNQSCASSIFVGPLASRSHTIPSLSVHPRISPRVSLCPPFPACIASSPFFPSILRASFLFPVSSPILIPSFAPFPSPLVPSSPPSSHPLSFPAALAPRPIFPSPDIPCGPIHPSHPVFLAAPYRSSSLFSPSFPVASSPSRSRSLPLSSRSPVSVRPHPLLLSLSLSLAPTSSSSLGLRLCPSAHFTSSFTFPDLPLSLPPPAPLSSSIAYSCVSTPFPASPLPPPSFFLSSHPRPRPR
ncbi:hypothetical protein DFH09DRAFT_1421657, partial [Mycena vulgaris]